MRTVDPLSQLSSGEFPDDEPAIAARRDYCILFLMLIKS